MSEFFQYDMDTLLTFSPLKLKVLYKEALRQRASKALLQAQVINRPYMSKEDDRELKKTLEQMLSPHYITEHEINKKVVEDSWAFLKARAK